MSAPNSEKTCPSCKKPLAADVPLGLCPECLIKSGFLSGTGPGTTGAGAGAAFTPPAVEEIRKLFPQLEIVELIGKGGMGAVYKARQPLLNRSVALKILAKGNEADARFAERFQREAQALAKMNHPNIVTVYDFGQASGLYYLIMEHVDGVNLRQLERTRKMTPEEALAIVPPICEALQYAHQQGIVHRDIKPENILLDKQGHVKIADFGIAKILCAVPGQPLTGDLQTVGTPHYMAPEQVEKPATVDHRADIYSLGVVFYEMLTGELPLGRFAAPSKKVQVDVRLDEVVLRALEKEPERRYQQASQFKTQVETIAAGAADRSPSRLAGSAATSKTALIFAGLSGVLGIVAFCLFPRPPAALVWSVLVAALLGMFLGIATRKSRGGKQAIAVGGANIAIWLVVLMLVNVASERDRRVQDREGARSDAPIGGQFTSDGHSIVIVDDNVDVHYLIYYDGAFTVSGGCQRNVRSLNWFEDRSIRLNSGRVSGRRFGFQRESTFPDTLRVNGEEFNLRSGRVLVLQDEGTVEQVALWLSVADARGGLEVLPEIIAQALAQRPISTPLPGTGPDEVADFSHRQLSVNDLERISSKPRLKRLDLSFSSISDDDLKYLEALKELEWLDLSRARTENGPAITDAGLTHLADLTKLRTLQLHGNPITDAGLEKLKSLPQLKKLQLGATRVTGEGLRHFTGLQWVRLDATPITDDGLAQLRNLTDLEQLYLDDTRITDAGLAHLVHLKKLRVLNLHDTKVTAEGVATLRRHLPNAALGINEDEAKRGAVFGPVIERQLSQNTQRDVCFIDLDRNKVFAPPRPDLSSEECEAWSTRNGIDAIAITKVHQTGDMQGLVGWNMRLLQVGPDNWQKLTPAELAAQLESVQPMREVMLRGENALPATFFFKTGEGNMGVLQITGFTENPRTVKIRYKLVQSAATKPTAVSSGFGPVIERVVNDDPANNSLIDLDTGKFVTVQPGKSASLDKARQEESEAFARTGADAAGLSPKVSDVSGLMGFDLVAIPVGIEMWDTASLEWVKDAVSNLKPASAAPMSGKGKLPATFVFKTREGGMGLLQVLGFKENPGGVMIRYKLVQNSRTKVAVSTSAAVSSQTAATFGPVLDRVLPFGLPCAMKYFQFHTGNVIAIGDGPGDTADHSEEHRRAEETGGLDADALGGEKGIQLAGHGCIFVPLRAPRDWEALTAEKVIQTLQSESWLKGVLEIKKEDFPATSLFKTAQGEFGILQILGFTDEKPSPSGVKLRYKLLQRP